MGCLIIVLDNSGSDSCYRKKAIVEAAYNTETDDTGNTYPEGEALGAG